MRRYIVLGILFLALLLLGAGCATMVSGVSVINFSVTPDDVYALWKNQEGFIIDVRSLPEYEESHIPGVKLIPLDQLAQRLAEVPREGKVFVICRSGSRSSQAVAALREKGFANVYNAAGGMLDWKGPLVKNL